MINETTVLGGIIQGLVVNIFGSEIAVVLFLFTLLVVIGLLLRLAFPFIMLALTPLTIIFHANGWLPGAVAIPIYIGVAIIVAFSFFNR